METEVPVGNQSLLDPLTTFQNVQSDTTIRQILQHVGTLLGYPHLSIFHVGLLEGFLSELTSLSRPTYDPPGGLSTNDLLNRGRLWLHTYAKFLYYLTSYIPSAIHANEFEVHTQLADIESIILDALDKIIAYLVNCGHLRTRDAETHTPRTDQIVEGRQKLEADFNSRRALLYRVWDFHPEVISAAIRALYSELAAHPGSHSQLHPGSPLQLHQVPLTHPGNHSQLHPVPSTHSGIHAMPDLIQHLWSHSQLHPVPSTHPGNHSQLHPVPSTQSGSHAMHELIQHPWSRSQFHPVPSTHPGNHSQLHPVPSTHSGSHAMHELIQHPWSRSQFHPVPSTHPGNHSMLHPVPSTHSGSHAMHELIQHPTGVEEQPLVNRPRLPETFLGITSQAALAMLTISISGSTSFSHNEKILFCFAVACNVIGFLVCLFLMLLSGRRTGVAPRIVTGTGFVFTAYGFLAIMGMLLSDNIMLWVTGLACIACFPALVSAFM